MNKQEDFFILCQEVLEKLWMLEEDGANTREALFKNEDPPIRIETVEFLEKEKMIAEENGKIVFLEKGREDARALIRSHRISERLFTDILNLKDEYLEGNACQFEHILSPEVTEAICTLLGHPGECPHGRPIPPGLCCENEKKTIESIIVSLDELKPGAEGKVVYISSRYHSRLDSLMAFGLNPGTQVRMLQKYPSFVIKIGETELAMDEAIIKDIYVRRITK